MEDGWKGAENEDKGWKLGERGSVEEAAPRSAVKDRIKIAARADFFVFRNAIRRRLAGCRRMEIPINFTSRSTITAWDTAERGCGHGGCTTGMQHRQKRMLQREKKREMCLLVPALFGILVQLCFQRYNPTHNTRISSARITFN